MTFVRNANANIAHPGDDILQIHEVNIRLHDPIVIQPLNDPLDVRLNVGEQEDVQDQESGLHRQECDSDRQH